MMFSSLNVSVIHEKALGCWGLPGHISVWLIARFQMPVWLIGKGHLWYTLSLSWFCIFQCFSTYLLRVFCLIITLCFLFILVFMVVYELFPVSLVCPLPVFCFLFYFVVSVPSVFSFFTSCLCYCLHQPSCVPPVSNCPCFPCVCI